MDNSINSLWCEKYRPTSLDLFIGNEHLKTKLGGYLSEGDIPHLLLFGPAGTGKPSISKILYNTIDCDHIYINTSDKGGVDFIRTDIIPFASSMGFKEKKIVVLDEFDYSSPQFQAALRNTMETFSNNCRFILTCNYVERIIDPIQSRCQPFQVIPPVKKEIAIHIKNILDMEGIEYNVEDIVLNVNSGYPDIRRIINSVQRQSIGGKLVVDKRSIIENDYKLKVLEILKTQDKKNAFQNIRQLLADSQVRDFADLFKLLYDDVDIYAKGHVAEVILIIAKYELSDVQVVDKEINAMAMIIEILGVIK